MTGRPMAKRPNFLIIVADDLGYSDIGCYGSEIETPNLDRLAREGLRFSDFHTASLCSPTRSMLMSGTDCHLAGLGVMAEYRGMDPERWNRPGHEGYLNHDVAALPELLRDGGYHTYMAGKWHLGWKDEYIPASRGFDKSWALLPGCSNHFGWEPQFDDGIVPMVPGHVPGSMIYVEGYHRFVPEPNSSGDAKGFYSTQFYTDKLLTYLSSRSEGDDMPFFAYLPFSAPHWPLQCLAGDRDKYKGKYDDGPDALRLRRLENLKRLGLIARDVVPHPVSAETTEWSEMTLEEKKLSSRAMECYAGMVDRIDQEVGKVVRFLEDRGELNNTLVLFMSDNGAEGAANEANPVTGGRIMEVINKYYDNSYDNLGNYNSYCWYGPRWAQASTAPNRMYKYFSTEGGIRVPLVIRYVPFNALQPSSICHAFATVMDIMPTLLSLAGVIHPNQNPSNSAKKAPYQGLQVYPMRGKDWSPFLAHGIKATSPTTSVSDIQSQGDDDTEAIHGPDDPAVGWEMHALASLRKGKWKIVNMPANWATGTGDWQLYDLSVDQGETNDLAVADPDKLKEMLEYWEQYVQETGTVFGPVLAGKNRHKMDLSWTRGGDPIEDMRAWMRVGNGKTLSSM